MKNYLIETLDDFVARKQQEKQRNEAYYYSEGDLDALFEKRKTASNLKIVPDLLGASKLSGFDAQYMKQGHKVR